MGTITSDPPVVLSLAWGSFHPHELANSQLRGGMLCRSWVLSLGRSLLLGILWVTSSHPGPSVLWLYVFSSENPPSSTWVLLPAVQPGNSFQAVSWDNPRAPFVCFASSGGHCPLLPDDQYLADHILIYFVHFSIGSGGTVYSITVSPSFLKAKLFLFVFFIIKSPLPCRICDKVVILSVTRRLTLCWALEREDLQHNPWPLGKSHSRCDRRFNGQQVSMGGIAMPARGRVLSKRQRLLPEWMRRCLLRESTEGRRSSCADAQGQRDVQAKVHRLASLEVSVWGKEQRDLKREHPFVHR